MTPKEEAYIAVQWLIKKRMVGIPGEVHWAYADLAHYAHELLFSAGFLDRPIETKGLPVIEESEAIEGLKDAVLRLHALGTIKVAQKEEE